MVAYREGALNRATLIQFRDGMLHAEHSAFGVQLLTLWRLTGFVPVLVDYDSALTKMAASYRSPPAPSHMGAGSTARIANAGMDR